MKREYTHAEREAARACNCQSCRKEYDLPEPPPPTTGDLIGSALALGGLVVAGVLFFSKAFQQPASQALTKQ